MLKGPKNTEAIIHDDDWHRPLVENIIAGIESTSSDKIRSKLEDALEALNEHDECWQVVDEVCFVPEGVPCNLLLYHLRKSFEDKEIFDIRPKEIRLLVTTRGARGPAIFAVRLAIESAIRDAETIVKKSKTK